MHQNSCDNDDGQRKESAMAVEAARGCGYRKVGGLYLCSDPPDSVCCRFPIPLEICPTCSQGVKQSRGWTWLNIKPFIKDQCINARWGCILSIIEHLPDQVGLIWVGEKFYARPIDFLEEAQRLGISRKLKFVPRGFKLGETRVCFAHPKATLKTNAEGKIEFVAGIIAIVTPDRWETIITETQAKYGSYKHQRDDVNPIIVPDHDPDHRGYTRKETGNGNQRQESGTREDTFHA
jgi:hypothetical protein